MHQLIPAALASFLAEYPEHDVEVAEKRTPQSVRLLASGEADLGIILDDEPTRLRTEPLADDSLVVIGQTGGILAGRSSLSYAEFAEHPVVGLDLGSSLRTWIDRRAGPHAPAPRYRTLLPNLHALITLVTAGAGLAIAPRRAVDGHPGLDICPLQDTWSARRHLLCFAAAPNPTTELLANHLRRAAGR